jgi:hypothetical protein
MKVPYTVYCRRMYAIFNSHEKKLFYALAICQKSRKRVMAKQKNEKKDKKDKKKWKLLKLNMNYSI